MQKRPLNKWANTRISFDKNSRTIVSVPEQIDYINAGADFWRYVIGVNVIPADTKNKRPLTSWSQYQDSPIPEEVHNKWRSNGDFSKGIAILPGKIFHNDEKLDYFLVCIDADNLKAINEICKRHGSTVPLQTFAEKTLVEQHKDDQNKAHLYFYATRPIKGKGSDQNTLGDKISSGEVPAIEIKSLGSHGLLYCSPSVHKNGYPYEIIGTKKPAILNNRQTNELEIHLDKILTKYGIVYQSASSTHKVLTPIQELFRPGHKVLKGHNRHEDLLRVMDSLIRRNIDIMPLERIKQLAGEHNTTEFYEEPISNIDFERQWIQAVKFIERSKITEESGENESETESDKTKIQKLVDLIIQECIFVTTTDNQQLYYFNGQIYIPDQEWIIKKKCRLLEPKIKTYEVQEVINYIKDLTYVDRSIFDSNPDLLVVENGILNIHTQQLEAHSPDHYALSILPVRYDPNAICPEFSKFLKDVLGEKKDLMLTFIGYCLYKSAKFEKAALCIGKGDNGKSTLLKALDLFFGPRNTSHTSLQDLSGGNRFAGADLYGKMTNTFADLKAEKLKDTGPFKMFVSGDWIRAEEKHVKAFTFQNYAKLIFSCNTIPQSDDTGYAYFKRWLIFHFERVFTGEQKDTKLLEKITTLEEKSGLLNLALQSLKQLIEDNGFTESDSIETVEKDYIMNSNTVASFIEERCQVTNNEDDYIICRDLHAAYVDYCNSKDIPTKDDNVFGSELALLHIKKDRITVKGTQEYVYMIKLRS